MYTQRDTEIQKLIQSAKQTTQPLCVQRQLKRLDVVGTEDCSGFDKIDAPEHVRGKDGSR